ncbi:MAG TPA: 2-dehydropantoate 2-reductase N-terminal domain-containing protein [Anaerolineales bacterium]|nr:2-dehydropantoate 2-reductase N-terminal domain-containing protein [Anaerolineales bacterium]
MVQPLSQSADLKFLVFGAGAIGTYIGGSLALAGHQVVFVEQPEMVKELRQKGLRLDLTIDESVALRLSQGRKRALRGVEGTKDAFIIDPRSFVIEPSLKEALKFGPFDTAIFALKSFDTLSALEGLKSFADKLPPLLCLSNGVENEQAIASVLGADKVIYGTVTSAIGRRGPGDIVLEKLRGVGVAAGHPLSEKLVTTLDRAFLKCRLYPEAHSMKWSKMLTNLIANPTSAILNMTAAQVFANRKLYKLEIDMLKECLAVMKAQNLKVVDLPGTPVKALAFATKLPLWLSKPFLSRAAGSGRGAKMPSFHIDLYSARSRGQSEVQYLHGAVVREGKARGIPTPVNELLTDTLMALTKKEIPLEEYANQPEKLLSKVKGQKSI